MLNYTQLKKSFMLSYGNNYVQKKLKTFIDSFHTKESSNVIRQDHFDDITWVFVYKTNEALF